MDSCTAEMPPALHCQAEGSAHPCSVPVQLQLSAKAKCMHCIHSTPESELQPQDLSGSPVYGCLAQQEKAGLLSGFSR